MSEGQTKPLHWTPDPEVGFRVNRRDDGGMHVTFNNIEAETLAHWREFALEHLLESDRLTRNLYDLRGIEEIPDEAVQVALEVNSDPSARRIRVAVVVSTETVRQTVEEIAAMTTFGSARLRIFTDLEEAESWLSRPLNTMI